MLCLQAISVGTCLFLFLCGFGAVAPHASRLKSGLAVYALRGQADEQLFIPLVGKKSPPPVGTPLISDEANNTQPSLSPDGKTLVYVSDRSGRTDLYRVTLPDGVPEKLTETATADEATPVFSPDGSSVAFASNRTGDWDIYRVNLSDGETELAIGEPSSDELHPNFMPDGHNLLFSSNRHDHNWDIYSATTASGIWTRLIESAAVERFPTVGRDGTIVAFRYENSGNSDVYVMDVAARRNMRVTSHPAFDGYPVLTPDGSGLVFVSTRGAQRTLYSVNLGGSGLVALTGEDGWSYETPRLSDTGDSIVYAVSSVTSRADIYALPYSSPLLQVAKHGLDGLQGNCDWEAGVWAYGVVRAWRSTGLKTYGEMVKSWIDGCITTAEIDHVNDGLLGYAALAVYSESAEPQYLEFARRVAEYLAQTAQRTPSGTLTHIGNTVWVDTLVSVVPFYVEMSSAVGDITFLEEAVFQVASHADTLQDDSTGLFHHAWDVANERYLGPHYWNRGNAWPLLAAVEVLASIAVSHPARPAILDSFRRQAAALKELQANDGRWHTILTRTDFYMETSGSAMIGYALRQGVLRGWLNGADFADAAASSLFGVWQQVEADGRVRGVSAPTGPMAQETAYDAIPISRAELYGQGAVLLAGSPMIP